MKNTATAPSARRPIMTCSVCLGSPRCVCPGWTSGYTLRPAVFAPPAPSALKCSCDKLVDAGWTVTCNAYGRGTGR